MAIVHLACEVSDTPSKVRECPKEKGNGDGRRRNQHLGLVCYLPKYCVWGFLYIFLNFILICYGLARCFPSSSVVKTPPAMQETQVRSLGWKEPLERTCKLL